MNNGFDSKCTTTLAGLIETALDQRRLQVDHILSILIPDSARGKSDRDLAYRAMHMLAEELLRCGHAVTLDATYGTSLHHKAVETLVTGLAVPLYLIECHIPPDNAVARLKSRADHPAPRPHRRTGVRSRAALSLQQPRADADGRNVL